MELDTVLTVAIGDTHTHGGKMRSLHWSWFKDDVRRALTGSQWTIVAEAAGTGATSDQEDVTNERTLVFIAINGDATEARREVAQCLRRHTASSACFAIDGAHEPAFPTADGFRPPTGNGPATSAKSYAPSHGGYPNTTLEVPS